MPAAFVLPFSPALLSCSSQEAIDVEMGQVRIREIRIRESLELRPLPDSP
jgi:hypothetical protein